MSPAEEKERERRRFPALAAALAGAGLRVLNCPFATLPAARSTTRSGRPRPDGSQDVAIKATVLEQSNPVSKVELVYVIGYGGETTVPMAGAHRVCIFCLDRAAQGRLGVQRVGSGLIGE